MGPAEGSLIVTAGSCSGLVPSRFRLNPSEPRCFQHPLEQISACRSFAFHFSPAQILKSLESNVIYHLATVRASYPCIPPQFTRNTRVDTSIPLLAYLFRVATCALSIPTNASTRRDSNPGIVRTANRSSPFISHTKGTIPCVIHHFCSVNKFLILWVFVYTPYVVHDRILHE